MFMTFLVLHKSRSHLHFVPWLWRVALHGAEMRIILRAANLLSWKTYFPIGKTYLLTIIPYIVPCIVYWVIAVPTGGSLNILTHRTSMGHTPQPIQLEEYGSQKATCWDSRSAAFEHPSLVRLLAAVIPPIKGLIFGFQVGNSNAGWWGTYMWCILAWKPHVSNRDQYIL